jgi:hypothetical protein
MDIDYFYSNIYYYLHVDFRDFLFIFIMVEVYTNIKIIPYASILTCFSIFFPATDPNLLLGALDMIAILQE